MIQIIFTGGILRYYSECRRRVLRGPGGGEFKTKYGRYRKDHVLLSVWRDVL